MQTLWEANLEFLARKSIRGNLINSSVTRMNLLITEAERSEKFVKYVPGSHPEEDEAACHWMCSTPSQTTSEESHLNMYNINEVHFTNVPILSLA